ncbi:MAG: hydrogenase maturation nickel metallochaperone HypA [Chloroflexota bacterium]
MHELGIVQQIVDQAAARVQAAGAGRVTGLHLVIGTLSDISPESVQFYFDLVSKGTPAAGAQLSFRQVQPAMRCRTCGTEFFWAPDQDACPRCGARGYELIRGREFYLESIDVA